MSYRGTFVTERISCEKCFEVAREELDRLRREAAWIRANVNGFHPRVDLVAGWTKTTYPGGDRVSAELEVVPALEARLCHPLTLAVLGEDETAQSFTAFPPDWQVRP